MSEDNTIVKSTDDTHYLSNNSSVTSADIKSPGSESISSDHITVETSSSITSSDADSEKVIEEKVADDTESEKDNKKLVNESNNVSNTNEGDVDSSSKSISEKSNEKKSETQSKNLQESTNARVEHQEMSNKQETSSHTPSSSSTTSEKIINEIQEVDDTEKKEENEKEKMMELQVVFNGLRKEHRERMSSSPVQTICELILQLQRFTGIAYKIDPLNKLMRIENEVHYTGKPTKFVQTELEWVDYKNEIFAFAKAFMTMKLDIKSFGVLICTDNNISSYEIALGGILAGHYAVFVDKSYTSEMIHHIINECNIRYIVYDRISPHIKEVGDQYGLKFINVDDDKQLHKMNEIGLSIQEEELIEFTKTVKGNDICDIVYSCSEDGKIKGSIWTHDMIVHQITELSRLFNLNRKTRYCHFLPQSYYMERIMGLYLPLHVGNKTFLTSSVVLKTNSFIHLMKKNQPTLMYGTPRMYFKMYTHIYEKILHKKKASDIAFAKGKGISGFSKEMDGQHKPKWYGYCKKILYHKVLKLFGLEDVHHCLTTKLDNELLDKLVGCGLKIFEGIVFPETCGYVTINRPFSLSLHSYGRLIDGMSAKIKDGLLCVKGDCLSPGYVGALEYDCYTSDLFKTFYQVELQDKSTHFEERKFFIIRNINKNQVVTSNDVIVYPEPIEQRIREIEGVENCMVVGNGYPFLTALITVNDDIQNVVNKRLERDVLMNDEVWKTHLKNSIENINNTIPKPWAIKKFTMVVDNPTTSNVPTIQPVMNSNQRSMIISRFTNAVNSLYFTQPTDAAMTSYSSIVKQG
ncbi:AMP dependent ligase/synthetase [Entamoeba marina]